MFSGHPYVIFREMSVQVFCLLFDSTVCISGIELHELILEINPLSVLSFAIVSSHSEG